MPVRHGHWVRPGAWRKRNLEVGMFVLDTNHLRELGHVSLAGDRLRVRMESHGNVVTTIVNVEEAMRGWLARLAALRDGSEQVGPYDELDKLITLNSALVRLPWDHEAAARFKALRKQGIRIGTMDLKIACITMEHDATLLTRNTSDFAQVPGLLVQNWLD